MKTQANKHFRQALPSFVLITLLSFILCNSGFSQTAQVPREIITALEKGDASDLANHFNTTIDLKIPGHDAPCSKKQAGQIMKRFFEDHPVKQFKSEHQGTSRDGSVYMIGSLKTTDNKTFRVYLLIKKRDGVDLIQQLQFDEE